MAIDRGPWTALVDDDGSNLTGSIWNKAAIKTTLLDPIDTLVGEWRDVPFNAANFVGITVPGASVNRTQQIGKTLFWNLTFTGATIAAVGGYDLVLPWGLRGGTLSQSPVLVNPITGGWGPGRSQAGGGATTLAITPANYAPFTASGAAGLQMFIALEVQ